MLSRKTLGVNPPPLHSHPSICEVVMWKRVWLVLMLALGGTAVLTAPNTAVADHHRCTDHTCTKGSDCPWFCTACMPLDGVCGPATTD